MTWMSFSAPTPVVVRPIPGPAACSSLANQQELTRQHALGLVQSPLEGMVACVTNREGGLLEVPFRSADLQARDQWPPARIPQRIPDEPQNRPAAGKLYPENHQDHLLAGLPGQGAGIPWQSPS